MDTKAKVPSRSARSGTAVSAPGSAIELLIVEDDPEVASGVASACRNEGWGVAIAESAEQGLEVLAQRGFDVVILDVWLPGIDGFELLRRLRESGSCVPVLCLTARATVDDRVRGLKIGADDYLVKPFAVPELIARVQALARRAQARAGKRIAHGPLEVDYAGRRAFLGGELMPLPDRDWQLLSVLVANAGKTVSRQAIIDALAQDGEPSSAHAVEIKVSRLRARLDPAGIRIRAVRGFGYLMLEPESA